jgi:hypothetical protein
LSWSSFSVKGAAAGVDVGVGVDGAAGELVPGVTEMRSVFGEGCPVSCELERSILAAMPMMLGVANEEKKG